jgi:hypothetical protein
MNLIHFQCHCVFTVEFRITDYLFKELFNISLARRETKFPPGHTTSQTKTYNNLCHCFDLKVRQYRDIKKRDTQSELSNIW